MRWNDLCLNDNLITGQNKIQIPAYQNTPEIPINRLKDSYPNRKGECFLCNGNDAIKWGFYTRSKIDNAGEKGLLMVQRFKCLGTGKTFSFLPEDLIPYRIYCLELIISLLEIFFRHSKLSQYDLLEKVTDNFLDTSLVNISFPQLKSIMTILERARNKYCSLLNQSIHSVVDFFELCKGYVFAGRQGALAVKQMVYMETNHFLFGTASQFR